jgi:large subunit ribosomal protein L17
MRHSKRTFKIGRTSSHRRCMVANFLKSLINHERVETTLVKAKHLKRKADRLITLAKANSLASRRAAVGELMVQFNPLTAKEARRARGGDQSAYNADRRVVQKLFTELGPRFRERQGGYTRIVRLEAPRRGDRGDRCVLEYLSS